MLVTLGSGLEEWSRNSGGINVTVRKGQPVQLEFALIQNELKEGILVKAAYPEIKNNALAAFEFKDYAWVELKRGSK